MKVFNLTDVPTDALAQYQMVDQTLHIGEFTIAPGESVEVGPNEETFVRAHLTHFLTAGAVAVDEVPESYTKGKATKGTDKGKDPPSAKSVDKPSRSTHSGPEKLGADKLVADTLTSAKSKVERAAAEKSEGEKAGTERAGSWTEKTGIENASSDKTPTVPGRHRE